MIKEVNYLTATKHILVTEYNQASDNFDLLQKKKQQQQQIEDDEQISKKEINHRNQMSDLMRSTQQLKVRQFRELLNLKCQYCNPAG